MGPSGNVDNLRSVGQCGLCQDIWQIVTLVLPTTMAMCASWALMVTVQEMRQFTDCECYIRMSSQGNVHE